MALEKPAAEIRYATWFDADRIKAILDRTKEIFGFIPRPAVWHSIAKGELIVATPYTDSQAIVGFCRFHKRRDSIITIYEIYVRSEHRQAGIGKRIVDSLKGVIQAKCPVGYESNIFYQSIGFALVSVEAGKQKQLNVWRRQANG